VFGETLVLFFLSKMLSLATKTGDARFVFLSKMLSPATRIGGNARLCFSKNGQITI
jgi:hypothetical protein